MIYTLTGAYMHNSSFPGAGTGHMKPQKPSSNLAKRPHASKAEDAVVSNPYLEEVKQLKRTIPHWKNMYSSQAEESRQDELLRLRIIGEPLAAKYSWAIPDERSLNVLKHFSPLVEIGAGKGYWAKLLRDKGADIIAFDKDVASEDELWTEVMTGTPEVLSTKIASNRSLFLCYPDESESMAIECLTRFTGGMSKPFCMPRIHALMTNRNIGLRLCHTCGGAGALWLACWASSVGLRQNE